MITIMIMISRQRPIANCQSKHRCGLQLSRANWEGGGRREEEGGGSVQLPPEKSQQTSPKPNSQLTTTPPHPPNLNFQTHHALHHNARLNIPNQDLTCQVQTQTRRAKPASTQARVKPKPKPAHQDQRQAPAQGQTPNPKVQNQNQNQNQKPPQHSKHRTAQVKVKGNHHAANVKKKNIHGHPPPHRCQNKHQPFSHPNISHPTSKRQPSNLQTSAIQPPNSKHQPSNLQPPTSGLPSLNRLLLLLPLLPCCVLLCSLHSFNRSAQVHPDSQLPTFSF
ncbi:hypothetical protein K439DRAFT_239499 [Ramaria rubella]|nr:hypothetical protein K439DRAFT_239499 [Ramaria rubella]